MWRKKDPITEQDILAVLDNNPREIDTIVRRVQEYKQMFWTPSARSVHALLRRLEQKDMVDFEVTDWKLLDPYSGTKIQYAELLYFRS